MEEVLFSGAVMYCQLSELGKDQKETQTVDCIKYCQHFYILFSQKQSYGVGRPQGPSFHFWSRRDKFKWAVYFAKGSKG